MKKFKSFKRLLGRRLRKSLFEAARHAHKMHPVKTFSFETGATWRASTFPFWFSLLMAGLLALVTQGHGGPPMKLLGWLMVTPLAWLVVAYIWVAWVPHSDRWKMRQWHAMTDRHEGLSSSIDKIEDASRFAMFWIATMVRPGFDSMSIIDRLRQPVYEYAAPLLTTSCFMRSTALYMALNTNTLVIAPSGAGKTQLGRVIMSRLPGGGIIASTKPDWYYETGAFAALRGEPLVWDPSGTAVAPNGRWNVALGCETKAASIARARGLMPRAGDASDETWRARARPILAMLIQAIMCSHRPSGEGGRYGMEKLQEWVSGSDRLETKMDEISTALGDAIGAEITLTRLRGFFASHEAPRDSTLEQIAQALIWLDNPATASMGNAPISVMNKQSQWVRNPALFDPFEHVLSRKYMYLIAEDGPGGNALTGCIASACIDAIKELTKDKERFPNGQLDIPFGFIFDESDRSCPINLPSAYAEMRSRGCFIISFFQNASQLTKGWEDDGAQEIMANAKSILIFGGVTVADDVKNWATIAGQHLSVFDPDDMRMRDTIDAGYLSSGEPGRAVLFRQGMRPSTGVYPQWYLLPDKVKNLIPAKQGWKPLTLASAKDVAPTSPPPGNVIPLRRKAV